MGVGLGVGVVVATGDATADATGDATGEAVPAPIDDGPVDPVCANPEVLDGRNAPANRLASATTETPPMTLAIKVRREKASGERPGDDSLIGAVVCSSYWSVIAESVSSGWSEISRAPSSRAHRSCER